MKTDSVVTPPTQMPSDALIVKLPAANLRPTYTMPRGADRKTAAWNLLVANAAKTQAPLVALAEQLKASGAIAGYELLVAPNALVVDPASGKGRDVLDAFGTAAGVVSVYDQEGRQLYKAGHATLADAAQGAALAKRAPYGLDLFQRGDLVSKEQLAADERPWGLDMVGAAAANAAGADGTGLVFGSIDTGADVTHEAIAAKYRGRQADGSTLDDYSWFDFNPTKSPTPKDYDAHGTHTIGTVLGSTDAQQIGVAPNAKWISVHGLTGNLDVRLKALQFMLAPTMRDGSAPRPELAPDVVGMSWWTGSAASDVFADSMASLVAAGIEPVKSAGNKGPTPESITSPGQYPTVTAVAAVGPDGQIAEFSSRGPSPLPHPASSPGWKPDFSAPGVDVVSSVPGNRYQKMSGTSMAQPHMSGAMLAILSKFPTLTHDQLRTVLKESAVDAGARGQDLEFGYGIINLPKALEIAATLVAPKPVTASAIAH